MPRKDYKLFGLTVWSIEVTHEPQDESEDDEIMDKDIGSTSTIAGSDVPVFGFVTPFSWEEDEDV